MSRDLATRRMRVGYDRTLERVIWSASIPLALAAGFLTGYLWRKPVLIEAPKLVTAPAAYCACPVSSATSCLEVARTCVAQKRSMAVRP